jgi:integrase
LDYWEENGRRVQKVAKNASTQEDALRALVDAVTAAERRGQKEPIRSTFSEFAKLYIESYAKVNKRSWTCDNYCLEAHMKPCFGRMDLGAISALDIETYRVERLKAGVSKSTTNREMALLKKMYHLAMDWGYATENPVLKVKLFSERDNLKERVLTEAEEVKLLAACAAHLKPIVAFALNTGMRRGEILGLRWDQIDAKARTVRAIKTKSGRDRVIPLNDVAVEILKLQRAKAKGEHVFPSTKGNEYFKAVRKSFAGACRRAGISGLRFHDLRHTFATRLIQRGADIVTVQKLLGHSSVTITERYTHSGAEEKRAAVGLLVADWGQNLWQICDMNSTKKSGVRVIRSNIVN